jgi:hypothetical protein
MGGASQIKHQAPSHVGSRQFPVLVWPEITIVDLARAN